MEILSVVGARPNFMKVAPIHREMERRGRFRPRIVHTGQHYDERMSDIFFRQLDLPEPDVYLGVGSGSHAEQTARVMVRFEEILLESPPDLVVVVGDVNSTLAASLVAAKCEVPLAHVEAGLRSFDRRMPEEINRIVTDRLSDLLFVTEESGIRNLRAEGVSEDRIYFVGNVMIDSLVRFREKAAESRIVQRMGLEPRGYVLMTVHRPSNVDRPERLEALLASMERVASERPLVFPMHPRTRDRFRAFELEERLLAVENLELLEPLGYLEFLGLMDSAALVLTDSGGIQEETTFLRVPCITLRENTERPVTLEVGLNRLMPVDADRVGRAVDEILGGEAVEGRVPELWDGRAAARIVDVLEDVLESSRSPGARQALR